MVVKPIWPRSSGNVPPCWSVKTQQPHREQWEPGRQKPQCITESGDENVGGWVGGGEGAHIWLRRIDITAKKHADKSRQISPVGFLVKLRFMNFTQFNGNTRDIFNRKFYFARKCHGNATILDRKQHWNAFIKECLNPPGGGVSLDKIWPELLLMIFTALNGNTCKSFVQILETPLSFCWCSCSKLPILELNHLQP